MDESETDSDSGETSKDVDEEPRKVRPRTGRVRKRISVGDENKDNDEVPESHSQKKVDAIGDEEKPGASSDAERRESTASNKSSDKDEGSGGTFLTETAP